MKRLVFIIVVFLTFTITSMNDAFAQSKDTVAQSKIPDSGFGIMAGLFGDQLDLMIPIWATSGFQVVPVIGVVNASDLFSEVRIGAFGKFYTSKSFLSPYISIKLLIIGTTPENGNTYYDLLTGASFGGEYFFNQNFSVGLEIQLNYSSSDTQSIRFGNPGGSVINTGTMAFIAVYF